MEVPPKHQPTFATRFSIQEHKTLEVKELGVEFCFITHVIVEELSFKFKVS
jgi:hypothetical protein